MDLARVVYSLTGGFLASELYGLVSQMKCIDIHIYCLPNR